MAKKKRSAPEPETTSSQSRPKGRKAKGSVPGPEAVGRSVESLPDDSADHQTGSKPFLLVSFSY